MTNDDSLGENIELLHVPKHYRSSDGLIHPASEDNSEAGTQNDDLEENNEQNQNPGKNKGLFEGWKFTIFLAFTSSVVVLLFNVAFLLFTTIRTQMGQDAALARGNCDRVHRLSTGLHWMINALSTILLASSNFGMQVLLDIGVPSIGNLFRVSFHRTLLWFCLSLSSLPLHVFYNSAVYYQTAVPAYDIFVGPGSLGQMDLSDVHLINQTMDSGIGDSLQELFYAAKNGTLKHLDSAACVTAFGQTYQTSYGRLLLVSENESNSGYSLIYTNPVYRPDSSASVGAGNGAVSAYPWICPRAIDCRTKGASPVHKLAEHNAWNVSVQTGFETSYDESNVVVRHYQVEYCLAEPIPENCKLQYSVPLIGITVACNFVKACILLYIWIGMKEAPILTVGDAIASFLRRPDPYSKGMCLPSDETGVYIPPIRATPHALQHSKLRHPVSYSGKRNHWGSAISSRWGFFIFFWMVSFVVCIMLLFISIAGLSRSAGEVLKGKLGAISSETIFGVESSGHSLVASSFIANLPQLIFSFLYVAYNSLLTSMCLAAEWSGFGNRRKGLRVSHSPKLSQRSNYFLSIPYRYAIPLITTSAILHWLGSESLFVIAVEAYDTKMQKDPSHDLFACGYSPVAIISGVSVAIVMFTCLIVLSLRRFESAMPVAASCSLAIAAACHPRCNPNEGSAGPDAVDAVKEMDSECEDEEMEVLPVKWGAVEVSGPVGHCCFTSGEVYPLEEGKKYQ
ncbi:hypothetical protein P170DRAFT_458593 [Aspergillus steynii IBT 23096]|uniref:DUF6536 domain-containing protein n=1 Tax=Aspergillus steynii IBT 23096 TaxID=1392250 RepID=A0A2I2FWK3_9EURO|nr:uncharacterized protein P170DRAFT_458593 [Aspergillus steynii IBT 23096]PLB44995.1 hypothetical protein P170DRAFT_458593 [Aspergillus steynii IBT 23096]